jgi:hypothetical protein
MQYLFPFPSPKLCPRCVPAVDTVSPLVNTRTLSHTTSSSRNDGQPCFRDSSSNASNVRSCEVGGDVTLLTWLLLEGVTSLLVFAWAASRESQVVYTPSCFPASLLETPTPPGNKTKD